MKLSTVFLLLTAMLTSLPVLAQGTPKPVLTATPPSTQAANPTPSIAGRSAGPTDVPSTYVIGPDDSLAVTVWKEPTLSGSLPVRPDGMISLPLLGDVQAAGYTPMQLGVDLTSRLKKFVNDPVVTVAILTVNSKRVFLMGEVGHVGPLPLAADMTPLQAIASAGGVSAYANVKHVYILRTVAGKQQKIPFDYKKALKTGDQQGVTLLAGDTIVVP